MRRHRPLHDQYTQSSRTADEEDGADEAHDRQAYTAGTLRHSSLSDDEALGPRGKTAGTAVAVSPHLSCSPIPFYSAHASTVSSASENAARVRQPHPDAAAPQSFYNGASLRDGIPALLQHFTRRLEKPALRRVHAPDVPAAAPEEAHPLIVPQQQQQQRWSPPLAIANRRPGERARPGDRVVKRAILSTHSISPSFDVAAVPPPARYVLVQRPAAHHVLPHPSHGSGAPPAATRASTRRYRAVPSYSSGSEITTEEESYGNDRRSSPRVAGKRGGNIRLANQPARSHSPSLSSSSTSSLSVNPVSGTGAQHVVAQRKALPGRPDESTRLSHPASDSGRSRDTPPSPSPPSREGTLSSASDSLPLQQQQQHGSRMRSLLATVLSRSDSTDGVRAGQAYDPSAEERRPVHGEAQRHTHRIASPFTAPSPAASAATLRRPHTWAVAPSTAAVQEAGDPLVLRHTIDYLLAKAHRLERENAQLWWQTHSWDPSRQLEPLEVPALRPPQHPSPRHRSTSRPRNGPPRTHETAEAPSREAVFVERQPRVSLGVGRSASDVATPASISPSSGALSHHSSGGLATRTRPAAADVSGLVQREEVGVQSQSHSGVAADSPRPVRDSVHAERAFGLTGAAGLNDAAADSPRVTAHLHVDAAAQTESTTSQLLTPKERSLEWKRSVGQVDQRQSTATTAATPILSTVGSHRSLESRRSLGTMAALSTASRPLPPFTTVAPPEHLNQQRAANEPPSIISRPSTHNKQVQTASLLSPAPDEADDVLMASGIDGGTVLQLSPERTAVIELHTAAAYTSQTVRRLRNYCGDLEATRLQLRRRLSTSSAPASRAASQLPSPTNTSRGRHPPLPLPPPAATTTAAVPLRRPFFTTEYADPEVDATLHDVEEMAAVETMIVLQEDGTGSVTKRVVDGSPSRVSSSGARSSSLTSHYAVPGEGSSVSALGLRHRQAHRQQQQQQHKQRVRPVNYVPHTWRDASTSIKPRSSRAALPEGQRRVSPSTQLSEATGSEYVPVVVLGRAVRSASATSWNVSEALTYSPDVVPIPASEYGAAVAHGPPSTSPFVVPPDAPSGGKREEDLKPPIDTPTSNAAPPAAAAWPYPSSTSPPRKVSAARRPPGLPLDPPTVSVSVSASAPSGFPAPHTTVKVTGSSTRTSSAGASQRFAVRGRSGSAEAIERDTASRTPSRSIRSSSASSNVSAARRVLLGASGSVVHAGAAAPRPAPRSQSPPAASVGGRFAVPVGRSSRSRESVSSSTRLLPPTPPAAPLEGAAETSRLQPVSAVADGGAHHTQSTTTAVTRDDEGKDSKAVTGAAPPPLAEADRAGARYVDADSDVVSADGADSFCPSLPPQSRRSSSSSSNGEQEETASMPPPSLSRRTPGPLVSPSPPGLHVDDTDATEPLAGTPVVDAEKSALVSPSSLQRRQRAVPPLERPPVAPPRAVTVPRDASSSPHSPGNGPGGDRDSDADSRVSSSQWKSLHTVSSWGSEEEEERSNSVSSDKSGAVYHSAWF